MFTDVVSVVLTVNYVVQDGKSNWLEGMILMCAYTPPFFFFQLDCPTLLCD
jgi:Ca2+/H+ antiporter